MMQEIKVPFNEEKVHELVGTFVDTFNSKRSSPYDAFAALERMLTHLVNDMINQGLLTTDGKIDTKPKLTLVKNDEIV